MSEFAEGTVGYVGSKVFKGRTYWSFALEGENGVYYRTSLKKPPFSKGDTIQFEYEETQWGKDVDFDTIADVDGQPFTPTAKNDSRSRPPQGDRRPSNPRAKPQQENQAQASSDGYTGNDYKDKDIYWKRKEERDREHQKVISYNAAHNTAVTIVVAALDKELLPLSGSKTKGAKFDEFTGYVHKVADVLYERFMSAGKPAKKAEPLEKPDFDEGSKEEGGEEFSDD